MSNPRTIAFESIPHRPSPHNTDAFTNKVSIEKLATIWNDADATFATDELIRIREWLYTLAEVILGIAHRETLQSATIIPLLALNHAATESHSIHPGLHRRAS